MRCVKSRARGRTELTRRVFPLCWCHHPLCWCHHFRSVGAIICSRAGRAALAVRGARAGVGSDVSHRGAVAAVAAAVGVAAAARRDRALR